MFRLSYKRGVRPTRLEKRTPSPPAAQQPVIGKELGSIHYSIFQFFGNGFRNAAIQTHEVDPLNWIRVGLLHQFQDWIFELKTNSIHKFTNGIGIRMYGTVPMTASSTHSDELCERDLDAKSPVGCLIRLNSCEWGTLFKHCTWDTNKTHHVAFWIWWAHGISKHFFLLITHLFAEIDILIF